MASITAEAMEGPDKRSRTDTLEASMTETTKGARNKTLSGQTFREKEKKIGHRRVDEKGQVTFKKKTTSELMQAIQLGIGQSIGGLSSKPDRDLLLQDFGVVESVFFPSEGSNMTPAHHCSDFRFKTYAPIAFRYFRELFNIRPEDFMLSLCNEALKELSNPGASGSIFYITQDDEFIIKTVQHKEADFLQKLLPGYYMNLNQNPRTLLPKFYGLYCYQCGGKNIRFVVMNNLLPTDIILHERYDLKGSTYKRKASKQERQKERPTLKDLDFMELHPDGLLLEKDTYEALTKTIARDCRVLESFKIMDFSLLLAMCNLDKAAREKQAENTAGPDQGQGSISEFTGDPDGKLRSGGSGLSRGKSLRTKFIYSTPMESIHAKNQESIDFDSDDILPGGIPCKNTKGERLMIYLGIIDILQCYRLRKKMEHGLKSIVIDANTISVTRPSYYAERFQKFFANTVFKKAPSLEQPTFKASQRFRKLVGLALKQSPSKRKLLGRGISVSEEQSGHIPGTVGGKPDLVPESTTPPPPFSEASMTTRRHALNISATTGVSHTTEYINRSDVEKTVFKPVSREDRSESHVESLRYSPLSVSESTPTYSEFTEGTPTYTASSPSCSSEVLDEENELDIQIVNSYIITNPADAQGNFEKGHSTSTMLIKVETDKSNSSNESSYRTAASSQEGSFRSAVSSLGKESNISKTISIEDLKDSHSVSQRGTGVSGVDSMNNSTDSMELRSNTSDAMTDSQRTVVAAGFTEEQETDEFIHVIEESTYL
ncbi:hypothetical protein CHS0354_008436 [Potamilus streckersoni]|uniref:PIPK domain-containing protein n=1 Tax=Potamilus streckersoni TaxID=2493646 RepID=A0AAE0RPW1_9BIVA|nr:hypothetical protein CHS0354_008436 [Potamilus streckersoni]